MNHETNHPTTAALALAVRNEALLEEHCIMLFADDAANNHYLFITFGDVPDLRTHIAKVSRKQIQKAAAWKAHLNCPLLVANDVARMLDSIAV